MKDHTTLFKDLFNRMLGTFAEHQWEGILRCYRLASRDERKARLRVVMELSVELVKIRKENIFCVAFGERIIEDIIEGDWLSAERDNSELTFEDTVERQAYYDELWSVFRAIVLSACSEAKCREIGASPPGN